MSVKAGKTKFIYALASGFGNTGLEMDRMHKKREPYKHNLLDIVTEMGFPVLLWQK